MNQELDGTTDGAFRHYEAALAQIAAGRLDNGRALSGSTAQEIARNCLVAAGVSWTGGVACSLSSNPHRDSDALRAEHQLMRRTLETIAGTAADQLQATQARGALANIGAALPNGERT